MRTRISKGARYRKNLVYRYFKAAGGNLLKIAFTRYSEKDGFVRRRGLYAKG